MYTETNIIQEITPLSEKDCFYIADRYKTNFTFPIHSHQEYELNFVEKTKGIRRVVGDSIEEIEDYDLVLIASPNLVHGWNGTSEISNVREITIQFLPELISEFQLNKKQFYSIKEMFDRAQCGLCFPIATILKNYYLLDNLAKAKEQGFDAILNFLKLLHELSLCKEARTLSSSSFAEVQIHEQSRRIINVQKFIHEHYSENIRLEQVSAIVNMTPVAFCRFFKLRTGKTFSEYIIDTRIGYASRLLIETSKTISEIGYECGFNNLSNFNRLFKREKGYTPTEFRGMYKKTKIII